jgi:hypothetical protein
MSFTTPPASPNMAPAAPPPAEAVVDTSEAAGSARRALKRSRSDPSLPLPNKRQAIDEGSDSPRRPLKRSCSDPSLPMPRKRQALGDGASPTFRRQASSPDLMALVESEHDFEPVPTGLLSLPDEAIKAIFEKMPVRDQIRFAQVSSRIFKLLGKELTHEIIATREIHELIDAVKDHALDRGGEADHPNFVLGGDHAQNQKSTLYKTIKVALVDILKPSKVADIDMTCLVQAPVSGIREEEKRAEAALLFSEAAASAIEQSKHLESVKVDLCTSVVLSSGQVIDNKYFVGTGMIDPQPRRMFVFSDAEDLPPTWVNLRSVDIGAPAKAGFNLSMARLNCSLGKSDTTARLHLRLSTFDIGSCLSQNIWQPHIESTAIAQSVREFGVGADTIKSITAERDTRMYAYKSDLSPQYGISPRLEIRTPVGNSGLTPEQRHTHVDQVASDMRRLINTTRVEVLPPQDSSTRFTPVDLKATGDVFLGVPKLETLVTQPVVAADAVAHELAVQCLLTQGQHHPHLTAIEIGDTRYSRGEAKPDVVFQKV